MLGEAKKTDRGFGYLQFNDANGVPCSVQQSSAIGESDGAREHPGSSMLWLGIEDVDPKCLASKAEELGTKRTQPNGWQPYPVPKGVLFNDRMHLNREQTIQLIAVLQNWVDTGNVETVL